MKNKNLVKKVAVASLAALISVPNIVAPTTVQAAYNQVDQASGVGSGKVVSAVNQGQYTLVNDDWGCSYLVNSNQWQEYQLLLQQGSPEVVLVITTDFAGDFHTIDSYQLKGQPEVKLPKNSCIKVNDPYNCDQLTVLKHIGNQLGTSYLYNQQKWFDDIDKKNQKIYADIAKQQAQQQAEAQRSAEESARNAQINAEMDIWDTKGKFKHNSQLPYTFDYLKSYYISEYNKNQEKLLASFDNERNYVQQWLNKNNLTLKQLRDMNYTTVNLEENSKKYGKQMYQANVYYQLIKQGELPQNCSTSDWIKYVIKKGKLQGWNWLALWSDNIDFSLVTYAGLNHFATYEDISRINVEVYNMIKQDFSAMLSYKLMSKEDCLHQIDQLCGALINPLTPDSAIKQKYPQYQSRTELHKKLIDEFNALYARNK